MMTANTAKRDTPAILDVDIALTNLWFSEDAVSATTLEEAIDACNVDVYDLQLLTRREQISHVRSIVGVITGGQGSEESVGEFARQFRMRLRKERGADPFTAAEHALIQGLLECVHEGGNSRARPAGIYDHFKGGVYRLDKVTPCGDRLPGGPLEQEIVDYISLTYGTEHRRFLHRWQEVVQWPDGKFRQRYVFRGKDLTVKAPSFKVPREP